MINKFNKTLSLIAAGTLFASNTCIISANADSTPIKLPTQSTKESDYIKLDYKDGHINNAVAFGENKFYINGNIINNIENNYYSSDDNLTLLTDFSSFDISLYGKNYLSAENGDYYIDLQTGEVIEDNLQENNLIDATINLRKKTRKSADDRYFDYYEAKSLNELSNYKFNDPWYETTFSSANPTNGDDSNTPLVVYPDIQGNYIDADYRLGTIAVVTTNKTVSITNTNESSENISIAVSNHKTIGHDASNIYSIATLTITSDEKICKINSLFIEDIENSAVRIYDNGQIVWFDVIQKISKEQSNSNIGGAKYPNTVETYILSDADGKNISLSPNLNYSISEGKIISYSINNNEITIHQITLKTSTDYNYIKSKKTPVKSFDAYDIDSSGELWILQNGFMYRYDSDEWVKTHRVDGLMDNLSVYDSNNFIVCNTDDDRYSIYSNNSNNAESNL
ncbi:MAG TPA: hypothetical protein DG753_04945 [Clostridium sp.]|nr:hypothetical protein [Clostridium sp.]